MTDDLRPDDQLDDAVLDALTARLDSDAVWAEPPADLEDRIVAAIGERAPLEASEEKTVFTRQTRSRPRWLQAVAALLILGGGVALIATIAGGDDEPEGDVFALGPTELADGASGEVELTNLRNGLRIILDVRDLPPAPEGQFYEAWIGRDGGGVSAGTFHMRNRTGEIELWAGVTTDEYSRFVITLEDEDGVAASSGRAVFVVELP